VADRENSETDCNASYGTCLKLVCSNFLSLRACFKSCYGDSYADQSWAVKAGSLDCLSSPKYEVHNLFLRARSREDMEIVVAHCGLLPGHSTPLGQNRSAS